MKLHPLCTLFPRMEGTEFETLKRDIQANGLREPITVHDGMILDGGNRYRACIDLGIEPQTKPFKGGSIVAFVLSANLHRRHMTTGQQAAIVASATDWGNAQTHGGNRKVQEEGLPLETIAQRAAVSGATTRTQRDADRLTREAPELAKQVTQGTKSLYRAVQEAKPATEPEPEDDGPSEEELRASERAEADDQAAVQKLLDSDDALAIVAAENKQLRYQCAMLELRIKGLLNEKAEAIKLANSWRRKFERAEKAAA